MRKEYIFYLLLSIIFSSCEYEFDSDNFISIEQPDLLNEYIELVNFHDLDTINVERVMVYNFLGNESQNTLDTKVYLDNNQISSNWDGKSGTFVLTPQNYEDGIHKIRIEHTFTSGSGSIADQSLLETKTEIAVYQFVVNRFPNAPAVLSAEIIDGTIFVEWESNYSQDFINSYLKLNFKNDVVKIPLSDDQLALGVYNDTETVLYKGNENALDFDEYSTVTYSILLENEYEESSGPSKSITYETDSIETEIVFIDFDSYKITWTAHPLYANFDTFSIGFIDGSFLGSSQGGEYIVNTPVIIGEEYTLNLRPNGGGFSLPNYAHRKLFVKSETSEDLNLDPLFIKSVIYNPSLDNFHILVVEDKVNGFVQSIYEYSSDMQFIRKSNTITHTGFFNLTLSPNNDYIYLDGGTKVIKVDVFTLQPVDEINPSQPGEEVIYRGDILYTLNYNTDTLEVTNASTNTVLYSGNTTNLSDNYNYLSPDAKYISISDETGHFLYRIENNNQLIPVYDFASNFITGNIEVFEDKLFYAINGLIKYVNLLNNTSQTYNFGTTQQFLQYDRYSENLLVSQAFSAGIINTVTNQITTFPIDPTKQTTGLFNQEDRDYLVRLWDNKLLHTKGIFIDLN